MTYNRKEHIKKFYEEHPSTDRVISEEDHNVLFRLIDEHNIKSVFEIGTWKGYTSALINSHPQIEKVKTIDINEEIVTDYKHATHILRDKKFYGEYIKGTDVELEFCDSKKYTPAENEQYDMVFIDGNHAYDYIENDTKLALSLNPKIIVWHDYESSNPDVLFFITTLQKKIKTIKYCENIVIV